MYLSLKIDINYHIKERCTITIIQKCISIKVITQYSTLYVKWYEVQVPVDDVTYQSFFWGGKGLYYMQVQKNTNSVSFFVEIWKLRKHNVHKFRFVFVSARQGHKIPRSQLLCKWVLLIFQVEWTRVQMILKG